MNGLLFFPCSVAQFLLSATIYSTQRMVFNKAVTRSPTYSILWRQISLPASDHFVKDLFFLYDLFLFPTT